MCLSSDGLLPFLRTSRGEEEAEYMSQTDRVLSMVHSLKRCSWTTPLVVPHHLSLESVAPLHLHRSANSFDDFRCMFKVVNLSSGCGVRQT